MQRIRWFGPVVGFTAIAWAMAIPVAARVATPEPTAGVSRAAATVVYLAGAVVCHQKPERSFHLDQRAFPVCARCTGIYAGAAAVSAMFLATARPRRSLSQAIAQTTMLRRLVIAALIPTAATLLWEWMTGVPASNIARAVAGVPLGAVVMWVLMQAAQTE